MATILLIETATKLCSVGLAVKGELIAIREDDSENYSHAEKTNVFIEEVCKEAGVPLNKIDAVAVGAGPGSYTGLRIGASIAKGLCFALDIPLIGISSLHSIAKGMLSSSREIKDLPLVPMIDARRNEVFTCVLDSQLKERMAMRPLILDEEGYASLDLANFAVGGDGSFKVENEKAVHVVGIGTSAKWMAGLAQARFEKGAFDDVAYFVPDYGKAAQPTKPKPRP